MKGPEGREDRLDFVLHVGLSKTGTTMLQQHFFPDIPEVYYPKNRPGAMIRRSESGLLPGRNSPIADWTFTWSR